MKRVEILSVECHRQAALLMAACRDADAKSVKAAIDEIIPLLGEIAVENGVSVKPRPKRRSWWRRLLRR